MNIFLILLLLMPLTAFANPLPHSKWVDESASQCPTSIFFGVKKYIFLNKCYARGSDGVVEKGIYSVSGKTLTLANRFSTAPGNFEFIPRDTNRLRINSLTEDRFVLTAGDRSWHFRRVTRGPAKREIHKPTNRPILFSPFRLDVHESPARL
jgi:hypothetical protein